MKRGFYWFVLAGALLGPWLPAQTPPEMAMPRYRFLFVVDTSFSMASLSSAVRKTVSDLIRTGIQGQMQPDDLWGIWTFNARLYTNRFTPVAWDPRLNQALANRAVKFLKAQPFENSTGLDPVWSALGPLARSSTNLTVIYLSDGSDSVRGSPFDAVLNQIYKHHHRELRQAKKPFVTTLVAQAGRFVAYTVNAAGLDIAFDDLDKQIPQAFPASPPAIQTNSVTMPPPVIETVGPKLNPPPETHPIVPPTAANPAPAVPPATEVKAPAHNETKPLNQEAERPSATPPPPQTRSYEPKPFNSLSADTNAGAPRLMVPVRINPLDVEAPLKPVIPAKPPLHPMGGRASSRAVEPKPAPAKPPLHPTAVVAPLQSDPTRHGFIILAIVLLTGGLALVYWAVHRTRVPRAGSSISRALGRSLK